MNEYAPLLITPTIVLAFFLSQCLDKLWPALNWALGTPKMWFYTMRGAQGLAGLVIGLGVLAGGWWFLYLFVTQFTGADPLNLSP